MLEDIVEIGWRRGRWRIGNSTLLLQPPYADRFDYPAAGTTWRLRHSASRLGSAVLRRACLCLCHRAVQTFSADRASFRQAPLPLDRSAVTALMNSSNSSLIGNELGRSGLRRRVSGGEGTIVGKSRSLDGLSHLFLCSP